MKIIIKSLLVILILSSTACVTKLSEKELRQKVVESKANKDSVFYLGRKKQHDYFRVPTKKIGYDYFRIPVPNAVVKKIMAHTPDGRKWIRCGPKSKQNWFK